MVKMDFNFAIFVTAFLCFHIGLASAIKIKITTDRYNGVVPTSFDVTCTLDPEKSGHYRTKRIVAIKVSRHGERPLAVLHRNSEIFYDQLLTANIKAKGRIDKDPRNTNMTVTFTDAMKEDSGVYNCSLLYWDQWGFIQREEASTNFTIENHNAHDVIRYLIGELKSMKNQLAELDGRKTTPAEKDDDVKSTLMFLVEKVSTLEMELSREKNESRALEKQLQQQKQTQMDESGALTNQVSSLTNQVSPLTNQVSSLTNQVKSQEKQLQQQKQTQMDESRALTNQVSSLTNQVLPLTNQVSSLTNQVLPLTNQASSLTNQVSSLTNQVSSLTNQVSSRTHQVKSQEKQLQQLEKTQMDESGALTNQVSSLTTQVSSLTNKVLPLTNQVSSLTHEVRSQEKQLQKQKDDLTVMFSAVYSTPNVRLSAGDVLVYGKVTRNEGRAYNGYTGTFTAPVAGYYMLQLSLFVHHDKNIDVDLQSGNGKRLKTVRAGDPGWGDYSDGSCLARLEAGEKVKPVVKAVSSGAVLVVDTNQGRAHYIINTFSGYLLKMV